jgi:hypothetical protein
MKSKMQETTTLSVTESELVAAVSAAQDMLYEMRVLESIRLNVQLPMVLEVDNKGGAIDLSHNWSVSQRSRHDSVRQSFLCELNEEGVIELFWIPTDENSSDIFTKNLPGPAFEKHVVAYCGEDEYMTKEKRVRFNDSQGEGVRE